MRSTLTKTLWQKACEDPEVMKKVIAHKECLDQMVGLCDVPKDISEADHAPGNLEPGRDGIVRGSDLSVGDKQKCAYQQVAYMKLTIHRVGLLIILALLSSIS